MSALSERETLFPGFDISAREALLHRVRDKRLCLPESEDPRVRAAAEVLKTLCGVTVVLGSPDEARLRKASNRDVIVSLYERRNKAPPSNLEDICGTPLVDAGCQLARGEVDAAVAGSLAETAQVIRAILMTVGLAAGTKTLTSAFLMNLPRPTPGGQNPLVFADGGVLPDPTSDQLVDIAWLSAQAREAWVGAGSPSGRGSGSRSPTQVAFLSFSTSGSAAHPSVSKVAAAAARFAAEHPEISAQGEVQFDAAIVPQVAERKLKKTAGNHTQDSSGRGARPGEANVLVFPNLDAGNITYKAVERLGGASAWGPIILGAAKPYSDLSRGCSALDIVHVAILTLALA